MDLLPPSHGPADRTVADPPAGLPDVAEAVTGRARDLHRLADQLSDGAALDGGDAAAPAVALLRAHAGAVDDLAEHLLAAGSPASEGPGSGEQGTEEHDEFADPVDHPADPPGPPRTAG